MERRTHYSLVEKHKSFPATKRDELLASVPGELLPVLAKHKIYKIEMLPNDASMGAAGGRYRSGDKTIRINVSRLPTSYGKTFARGVNSVSYAATDEMGAMSRTLVHEIGHHIYYSDEATFSPLAEAALKAGNPITIVAMSIREEYFAECFAAYYFQRLELQSLDPSGYDMVIEALKKVGVNHE